MVLTAGQPSAKPSSTFRRLRLRRRLTDPSPKNGLARARGGYPTERMLPPPDPYETPGPPPDLELASPWAVFLAGPPSDEQNAVSEAVLRFRPGLLFVANA